MLSPRLAARAIAVDSESRTKGFMAWAFEKGFGSGGVDRRAGGRSLRGSLKERRSSFFLVLGKSRRCEAYSALPAPPVDGLPVTPTCLFGALVPAGLGQADLKVARIRQIAFDVFS